MTCTNQQCINIARSNFDVQTKLANLEKKQSEINEIAVEALEHKTLYRVERVTWQEIERLSNNE